jgi:hypothetical protein
MLRRRVHGLGGRRVHCQPTPVRRWRRRRRGWGPDCPTAVTRPSVSAAQCKGTGADEPASPRLRHTHTFGTVKHDARGRRRGQVAITQRRDDSSCSTEVAGRWCLMSCEQRRGRSAGRSPRRARARALHAAAAVPRAVIPAVSDMHPGRTVRRRRPQ